ncbi:MAG: PEFG-CTERM sorting domain-containing protein [Thaumarchaeota archaeon]|nr:PEFG-CTERM sorting domain-containing protein [Nitrososphaerota archaeon]
MKTIAIGSFFVLFAIVAGMVSSPAFAEPVMVSTPQGTSVPGCEETNECFMPYMVTVDVGGEVIWSNDDTAAHTVTAGSAADGPSGEFDSSLFMAGTTFSHTFESAGEFPYFCMVHPWMAGIVSVGEAMMDEDGGLMVDIVTGSADQGESLSIDVTFTMMGEAVEHVNYDIKATQNGEVVLDEMGVHDHDGVMNHMTDPLPAAASDDAPVEVNVMFNGFGIDEPFTGPIGQVETAQVVPEFGTVAMMILAVAIISIVAVTAKTRVIPRL